MSISLPVPSDLYFSPKNAHHRAAIDRCFVNDGMRDEGKTVDGIALVEADADLLSGDPRELRRYDKRTASPVKFWGSGPTGRTKADSSDTHSKAPTKQRKRPMR